MIDTNDLAIVIIGYDGHSFLWDDFFALLKRNWPNCPCRIYLLSNEIIYNDSNIQTITTYANAEWSTKVQIAVNAIQANYFLLLLEDFFISSPINTQEIDKILQFAKKNNISYIKMPYKSQYNKWKKNRFKKDMNYYSLYKDEKYNISLLPSICKKDLLKEKVGSGNYRPWQFEIDRINEASDAPHIEFDDCVELQTNPFNILNGVVQGKYLPTTLRTLKKKGWIIEPTNLEVMSWSKYFLFRIKTIGLIYIPKKLHDPIKKILRKFNVKFVSETRRG